MTHLQLWIWPSVRSIYLWPEAIYFSFEWCKEIFSVALSKMVYKRMVEIGRVVYVAKGDGDGKLATIVDVVDENRVFFLNPLGIASRYITIRWMDSISMLRSERAVVVCAAVSCSNSIWVLEARRGRTLLFVISVTSACFPNCYREGEPPTVLSADHWFWWKLSACMFDLTLCFQALIDGPSTGVKRAVRNFKDLHLTKFVIPLRHGMRTKNVKKAYNDAKVNEKWAQTMWAQKIARKEMVSLFCPLLNKFRWKHFLKNCLSGGWAVACQSLTKKLSEVRQFF